MQSQTEAALKALAEPHRVAILALVRRQELPATEIAGRFQTTRSAISQHLGVLTRAGLLQERRDGTRRLYRVRPEGFRGLRQLLDSFWGDALDQLKVAAEREARRRHGR